MNWVEIQWAEWCAWVRGKTVRHTQEDYDDRSLRLPRDSSVTLVEFTDGSRSLVLSNSEPDWSDVTPGDGVQPPTVMVWR